MSRPAFLTGSRAYGTPREDSDVDLVVLLDDAQASVVILRAHADGGQVTERRESAASEVSASLVFGRLNLIIVRNEAEFDAWKRATERLVAERPVTREHAIAVIQAEVAGGTPATPDPTNDNPF